VKRAKYDASGGPISVKVSCAPTCSGSYDILLWEAGKNQVVREWSGNFLNADDDEFSLDKPIGFHNGRLLEAMIVVAVPADVGPSTVTMTVLQDGRDIERETVAVAPTPWQVVDLFIQLDGGVAVEPRTSGSITLA